MILNETIYLKENFNHNFTSKTKASRWISFLILPKGFFLTRKSKNDFQHDFQWFLSYIPLRFNNKYSIYTHSWIPLMSVFVINFPLVPNNNSPGGISISPSGPAHGISYNTSLPAHQLHSIHPFHPPPPLPPRKKRDGSVGDSSSPQVCTFWITYLTLFVNREYDMNIKHILFFSDFNSTIVEVSIFLIVIYMYVWTIYSRFVTHPNYHRLYHPVKSLLEPQTHP